MSMRCGTYIGTGVVLLMTATSGCTPTSSSAGGTDGEAVPTSHMHMHLHVESREPTTTVISALLDDGRLFGAVYRLDGGDYLRGCVAAECRNLRDTSTLLDVLFPFFPTGYADNFSFLSDTDYVVSFNRFTGGNAPASRVSLPPSFEIVTPVANKRVIANETVIVEWSPAPELWTGERRSIDVSTDCRHIDGTHTLASGPHGYDSDGDGREPIYIGDALAVIRQAPISSPIQYCEFTVTVEHVRHGTIDPAFADGDAEGVVSRRVKLLYYPPT